MRTSHQTLPAMLWLIPFVCLTPTLSAQVMLSPTAIVGTDLGTISDTAPLINLINHSGVEKPFTSGETSFPNYFTVPRLTFATNGPANNWQSDVSFNLPITGFVDFDLGAAYLVKQLAIWNVSVKDVTVRIADDPAGLAAGVVAGTYVLTDHTSFPFSYPVDILNFKANLRGRYVRLAISSTYPIVAGINFGYAIIGEVVASVVPNAVPSTLQIVRNTDGSVTVTFPGKLQTAPQLDGNFNDVPGIPSSPYTLPKPQQSTQQYFRALVVPE